MPCSGPCFWLALFSGLPFLVFGLDHFFHFLTMPQPTMPEKATKFVGLLASSGYLNAVKVLEVIGGALVLSGRLVPLGLTLLTPIAVNILLFEIFLVGMAGPGVALTVLCAFLSGRTARTSRRYSPSGPGSVNLGVCRLRSCFRSSPRPPSRRVRCSVMRLGARRERRGRRGIRRGCREETPHHLPAHRRRSRKVDVIFPWIRDGKLVTDRTAYLANRVQLRGQGLLVTGTVLRTSDELDLALVELGITSAGRRGRRPSPRTHLNRAIPCA